MLQKIIKYSAWYIGQFKDGLYHGKGKLYNEKGILVYEGDFINGKPEGKGKYIEDDGEYYIGQWKNGLKHGKGIFYYKNGTIKYDGNWINDKKYPPFIPEIAKYFSTNFMKMNG